MKIDYLSKIKEALQEMIVCLNTQARNSFHAVNSNIYSLMFNGQTLKTEVSMVLPGKLSGYFMNMMWNISNTGAYYGTIINGYSVDDIKQCVSEIIKIVDQEILKVVQIDNSDFYTNLLTACSLMQANIMYHDRKENNVDVIVKEDYRNYYLRDLLDYKGLYVRGQEHQGSSLNMKGSGEVDLLVCRTETQPKIYIECMNLDSVDVSKISDHYEKLFLYDASICKNNYLVSFVKTTDFASFCDRYKNYFSNYSGKTNCTNVKELQTEYSNIYVLSSESKHSNNNVSTCHILVYLEKYN